MNQRAQFDELDFENPDSIRSMINFLNKFRPYFAKIHGETRRQLASYSQFTGNFEQWCFTFLPQHFTKKPSRMHLWMFRYLEHFSSRRGEKVNVLAPRGGAKSTIGTLAYPLKMALETREPYIWLVSDTHDQACQHLGNLRQVLMDSQDIQSAYPFATGRGVRSREGMISLPNGVRIEAYGTGQKIRGRRLGAHRPSLIICDDLQNDSHARSGRQRFLSREWFFGTLLKAGNSRTNLIHLATALHRDALAMELTRTPGWKSRIFRAILEFPKNAEMWSQWEKTYFQSAEAAQKMYYENRTEMDRGAKVLWEVEEDLYTLMKMRAEAGHSAFEREKQNSPVNPDLCEWDESCFEFPDFWFDSYPEITARVIALDPSKGKHTTYGDYSAYVVLSLAKNGEMYVEAKLLRTSIDEMISEGVRLWREFHPDAFGIEGNQFQDLLADFFTAKLVEVGIPAFQPTLIHNCVSKEVRLRRLGPYLTSGKLHFCANSPGTRLLVEQLRQFPVGDHDDGPDALEMALRLLNGLVQNRDFSDGLGNNIFR